MKESSNQLILVGTVLVYSHFYIFCTLICYKKKMNGWSSEGNKPWSCFAHLCL